MALIDFILNLAGLLLWVSWRSLRFDPFSKRTPATLIGTLRRAEPERIHWWQLPAVLGGMLFLRAVLYWQIGSAFKPAWSGKLDLGIIVLSIPLHDDWAGLGRACLFSLFSFGLALGVFYLWLLLLSLLAGPEPPPFHRLVRMQLGSIDRWPRGVKWFLPLLVTAVVWWLASWVLAWLQVIPEPVSRAHRAEEALVIGLGSYPAWQYLAGVLLALHLLNSYIYFGRHPFWTYVNTTAQTLLSPLRAVPLRVGKADFAPVVGIVLVFLLAGFAGRGLIFVYGKLPF